MNERIKQLAAEAKIKPMGSSWTSRFGAEFEEKFAELIVRECGVALSPMLRDMVSRGQAYDLIKKHFGVTE
jgi:hypothetical protein